MTKEAIISHVVGALRSGRASIVRGAKGDHVSTDCPVCGKEDHFAIRVASGWYICFRCGLKGQADLAGRLVEWRAALRLSGRAVPATAGISEAREQGGVLYSQLSLIPLWTGEAGKPSRDYAARRGIDRETARRYKITADRWGCRLWFPYWDEQGQVTFFMGRTFVDGVEPKTIEPPGSTKPLYGLHVGIAYGREVFAVEGVFDHFATPLSVSLMGSELYDEQVEGLRQLGRRVFLLFDPDAKAKALYKVRRLRSAGVEACALSLEGTSADPADLGSSVMLSVVAATRRLAGNLRVLPPALSVHVRPPDSPSPC